MTTAVSATTLSRKTRILATTDELQAIKEFEENPVLVDGDEIFKKAKQIIERAKHV